MRLPEGVDDVEQYADFVDREVAALDSFVLVGDSFGAVVALALATRRPHGLRGLVMSGGFAANPVADPLLKARIHAARFLPGPLYRAITLRFHASSLASPFDADGQVPWSRRKSRDLFLEKTPFESYIARSKAAFSANYVDRLALIDVPTLILTPEHDVLIGENASRQLLEGIPDAQEVVVPRTGHMFRLTHPETYALAVDRFLRESVDREEAAERLAATG
jgi:pimeloyl-ACP methyl ester carboxylesterase